MDTTIQNSSGLSQPKSDGLAVDISALADSAKAKLGEIGAPVKDTAIEVASQQKDAGAEQLQAAARAVHGAARELESAMPQWAGYVHEFGQRLERFASDIRDGSVDDLMGKLGEFARNQPALLFGGALLTGLALSRFVKSSAQNSSSAAEMDTTGMGTPSGMSGMSTMQSGPRTLQSGGSSSGMGQGIGGGSGGFNRGGTGGSF
jgi:hypothetical protein